MLGGGVAQFPPVVQLIGVVCKLGLSIVATLDNMFEDSGDVDAGSAVQGQEHRWGREHRPNASAVNR